MSNTYFMSKALFHFREPIQQNSGLLTSIEKKLCLFQDHQSLPSINYKFASNQRSNKIANRMIFFV